MLSSSCQAEKINKSLARRAFKWHRNNINQLAYNAIICELIARRIRIIKPHASEADGERWKNKNGAREIQASYRFEKSYVKHLRNAFRSGFVHKSASTLGAPPYLEAAVK